MFEEMATSAAQLLLIIFGVVLLFVIAYGALLIRAAKQAKAK